MNRMRGTCKREEGRKRGGRGHTGQIEIVFNEIFMNITEIVVAR
jgi:hypothetical protein